MAHPGTDEGKGIGCRHSIILSLSTQLLILKLTKEKVFVATTTIAQPVEPTNYCNQCLCSTSHSSTSRENQIIATNIFTSSPKPTKFAANTFAPPAGPTKQAPDLLACPRPSVQAAARGKEECHSETHKDPSYL